LGTYVLYGKIKLSKQNVKMLKGISGRKLFLKYPEIKEKLWK
jgi:hypothetical protein